MKLPLIVRLILNQGVDMILFLIAVILLVCYAKNPTLNFTDVLIIYAEYVLFSIINKVQIQLKNEKGNNSGN